MSTDAAPVIPPATPQVSPQGPSRRTHPLSPLVSSWLALVAIGFFVLQDVLEGGLSLNALRDLRAMSWTLWVALGAFTLSVLFGFLSWLATRFRLDQDGLTVETRMIWHETKRLLFRRIQSVDIRQPLAARLLGLVELRVEIGAEGSSTLKYLRRQDAEALRQELLVRASSAHLDTSGQTAPAIPSNQTLPPPTGRLVAQSRPRDQIIGAVTATEFVSGLVALLIIAVLGVARGQMFGFSAIPFALGLGGFVLKRIVQEWRYRVEATDQGLRISCGMTDLSTSTTPRDRVHGFRLTQPLLSRPFGLWRVQVSVLGNETEEDGISDVALSIGSWRQAMDVVHEIWPTLNLDAIAMQTLPQQAGWFHWGTRRFHQWGLTEEVAVTRKGRFSRRIDVVDHARAQSLSLHQGPLDRRLGLASVRLDLIGGPAQMSFEHLALGQAHRVVCDQPALASRVRAMRAATGRTLSRPEAPLCTPQP